MHEIIRSINKCNEYKIRNKTISIQCYVNDAVLSSNCQETKTKEEDNINVINIEIQTKKKLFKLLQSATLNSFYLTVFVLLL